MAVYSAAIALPRVIAHRGYWMKEGSAQNSLSSLRNADSVQCYGSEFDVSVTSDGVCVVNHDADIEGVVIETASYADIKDKKLKNGEQLPTLRQYLQAGLALSNGTRLILEIKPHKTRENEDRCVAETVRLVEELGIGDRVDYISFSMNICERLAEASPKSNIAYLKSDMSPAEVKKHGFNGIDYYGPVVLQHPEWIEEAHRLGMSVNVWTINDAEAIRQFARLDVDFITTDYPEQAMEIIRSEAQPTAGSQGK